MIDIETLRSSLKQWKKEKILKICEEYSIPVNDELAQKTKKEIEHMIVEKAKQLNEQEAQGTAVDISTLEELQINAKEFIGKSFIRKDDTSNRPNVFKCEKEESNGLLFTFDGGKIVVPIEEVVDLFTLYEEKKLKQETLLIKIPTTVEKKEKEEPKVIKIDINQSKNKTEKGKKSETKKKEPLVGAGRGRLTAKIQCFDSPERKVPIKEFNTFADARIFLNVKSVGTSLERASETGRPSRGYWWIVRDIGKPNTTKEVEIPKQQEKLVEEPKNTEKEIQEEPFVTPPVMKKPRKKKQKEEDIDDFNLFDSING